MATATKAKENKTEEVVAEAAPEETTTVAAPEADGEKLLSIKEAADYLNRSTAWLNDEKRREVWEPQSTNLGRGPGKGWRIPVSVLEEKVSWKHEGPKATRRKSASASVTASSSADAKKASENVDKVQSELEDAKSLVVSLTQELKKSKSLLAQAIKAEGAGDRARQQKLAAAEKREAKLRAELASLEKEREALLS